jgi:hypothetical protein
LVVIQPEGKRRKRRSHHVRLEGYTLSITSRSKDTLNMAADIDLQDCVVRAVRLDKRHTYCIFLRNPKKALYYGVYYLYLVFKAESEVYNVQCVAVQCALASVWFF